MSAMRALLVVVAAAAFSQGLADSDGDVILPPLSDNSSLPERLLMFIPGALVPNHHYTPMLQAIQKASSGVRLTVVMPKVFQKLCIIECLGANRWACLPLKKKLDGLVKKSGFESVDPTQDTFVAGHSLGATCANYLVQGHEFQYAGLLEFGGYVDMDGVGSVAEFPIPVLHMAGEVDGGAARPGKLSWYYKQMREYARLHSEEEALRLKPVHVLEGLDHSDFCPGFFVSKVKDCKSEVAQDVALDRIGAGASAFLHLNSPVSAKLQREAKTTMMSMLAFTSLMCDPYLKAFDLETDGDAGPWCGKAQHTIAGLSEEDASKLKVQGKGCHLVNGSLHDFEHFHNTYNLSQGVLEVQCGAFKELPSNLLNTGDQVAAKSLDCKMLDGTRVAEQLQVNTNLSVQCADINRQAVSVAEKLLPEKTRQRYHAKGRKYCFKDDSHVLGNIGPLWVKSKLKQVETEQCMEVTSSGLISTVSSPIFPGSHYCKLLSPALALDWMYTDSHKPFPYNLSSQAEASLATLSKLVDDACLEVTMDEQLAQAALFEVGTCGARGFTRRVLQRTTPTEVLGDISVTVYDPISILV